MFEDSGKGGASMIPIVVRPLVATILWGVLNYVVPASAQEASAGPSNIECGVRIRLPSYPTIARAARIAGTTVATISLTSRGRPASVEVVGAHQLLGTAVERELRASEFSASCGGRRVRLVFQFVIDGEPAEHPQSTFTFMPPNTFLISTRPGVPMP